MTIEAKLDALTAAINNLAWAINGKQATAPAEPSKIEQAAKAVKKEVAEAKPEKPLDAPPAETPKAETPKAETPKAEKPAEPAKPMEYKEVAALFLQAYQKDQAKALAVLADNGKLASMREAKPEQYPAIAAALKALLA